MANDRSTAESGPQSGPQSGPTCRGILVVYAAGEGECDRRHDCQVYDLRWADHEAYLAAHQLRIRPADRLALVD